MGVKLPVLMYHHISLTESSGLTISVKKLEEQFAFLSKNKYKTYHFNELEDMDALPPGNNIIITFDDAYVSQLELAYPLLKKYGLKATIFVPLKYLGAIDLWNTSSLKIMDAAQLRSLDASVVTLGYHSYAHEQYDMLNEEEIVSDFEGCFRSISENKLTLLKTLAYPYGKYPRELSEKEKFISRLKEQGFRYGLRIGNRLNEFPFKNPFEIQRLDIKGEFSLSRFKLKLRFGKLF
jgi:peptidoglycan/xylan/chitin deacetylase (PgdA/CDA1 family)